MDQADASAPATPDRRSDAPRLQFIGFRVEESDYAVAIRRVQEIILLPPITRVPQSPPEVEGLINLRGAVLPVIGLRARFGLPRRAFDDQTRVVVVNVGPRTVGLIVDAVSQVMRVAEDQVQPPPPGIATVASSAIDALFKLEDRLVLVLDVERLLGDLDGEPDRGTGTRGGTPDPGRTP